MKILILNSLLLSLLLCAQTSVAENVMDLSGPPSGYWDNVGVPSVTPDVRIDFIIHETIDLEDSSAFVTGQSNAFQIFLSDFPGGYPQDPNGTFAVPDTLNGRLIDFSDFGDPYSGWYFDANFINLFSVDGYGADTIGFMSTRVIRECGAPNGFDEDVYIMRTSVDLSLSGSGKYLCIDSSSYPWGTTWLWGTTAGFVNPYWGGPYCYEIRECCVVNRGNVDMITTPAGPVDILDLSMLISHLFKGLAGTVVPCANVDGQYGPGGPVDINDLVYLVDYLFKGGPAPEDCP